MKKTAFLLIFITLLSKIMGLVRDLTLSNYYGTSAISDAYLIALTIPMVLLDFMGTAFTTGYIPMYNKVRKLKSEKAAILFTNNIVNILFVVFVIFTAAVYIFAPQVVKAFASGFEGETFDLAVKFTRISIFGMYFTGLLQLFSGFLQIKGNYTIPALVGFPSNICIIIGIILSSTMGLIWLPIGILVGAVIQFLMLLPFVFGKGYSHKFFIDSKDEHMRKMLLLALPIILGAAVNDINVLVDRTLASRIAVGGITALNYANRLNTLVQTIFVLSISTAMYPTISKLAAEENTLGFKKSIGEALTAVSLLVVPATVGFMVFARPIVILLFGRGAFDSNSIHMTAQALLFYSIGMIGFGYRQIIIRGFYALQDTKTPVINASLGVIINIILNVVLSKFLGISGLALATSIAAISTTIFLLISFRKKLGNLGLRTILSSIVKIIIASVIMGAVVWVAFNFVLADLAQTSALMISVGIGIAVYITLLYFMKIDDFDAIVKAIKNRIQS